MTQHASRRSLIIGAALAPAMKATGAPAERAAGSAEAKQDSAAMNFADASAFMAEYYRNDGPLRADDATGTTDFADWEKANSVCFRA